MSRESESPKNNIKSIYFNHPSQGKNISATLKAFKLITIINILDFKKIKNAVDISETLDTGQYTQLNRVTICFTETG